MLHPLISQELAAARRRDVLAGAQARRRVSEARARQPRPRARLSLNVGDLLLSLGRRFQGAGRQIGEGQAGYAFKQEDLSVACQDPACAC